MIFKFMPYGYGREIFMESNERYKIWTNGYKAGYNEGQIDLIMRIANTGYDWQAYRQIDKNLFVGPKGITYNDVDSLINEFCDELERNA